MNQPFSARRIQRVRHDLLSREVRVRDIQAISPGFLAITFAGESLSSFVSLSFDDHVKLILTDSAGLTHRRDFTPLRFHPERNELTLEFSLHEGGAACQWARQAKIGDPAVIGGPRGSMIIPTDYAWHLLAGDASALPATSEELVNAMQQLQLPPGEGFVWCAGEAALMTRIRDILLLEKQLPRDTMRVSAYWKSGAADFQEAKEH